MTALLKDRDTRMQEQQRTFDVPVFADAIIFAGALVSSNATGFAVPASDTAGERLLGRAEHAVDATGLASGAASVQCRKGVAEMENGGTVVDQVDQGRPVFILDDQTVSKVAGVANNVIAGVLDSFDAKTGKPWIKLHDPTE